MKKRIYAIYSKLDKDSTIFAAVDEQECIDTALQFIFDNDEFDEFFDLDGKISLNNKNKDYFYDILKEYQLYSIGMYDSESMRIDSSSLNNIDISEMLKAMSKAMVI